jgi:glycosyltransferase involved in cell wall biosynthesis
MLRFIVKIAFFTDTFLPQINGVSNTLCQFSRYLAQQGIAHRFFTPAYKDGPTDEGAYPVVRFPSMPFALYPQVRLALAAATAVRKQLLDFHPDVVHVVTEFSMGYAGLKAARQLGLPVVMSYHTNFDQYLEHYRLETLTEPLWQYMRWFHSFACLNLCPSENTLRRLTFRGIRNLAVWSRGIDASRFSPRFASSALRNELGGEDKLLYLYVGRISAEKGIGVYAESIRRFNARHQSRARFVFTGDGPYLPALKAMNLENAVFTGALCGQALSEVYASCDVFVFPSDNETFGNVMLEAMASGTPGICVDAGGLKDFTAHGENAFVCAPRDAGALTQAMEAMMDEGLREKIRAGALQTARERSWNAIFDDLLKKYRLALDVPQAV